MAEHKLLCVTWVDSRKSGNIFTPEEMKKFFCVIIQTVGWGYELEDRVILASEYYRDIPDTQAEGYREVCCIPKECIKQIIELKEGTE